MSFSAEIERAADIMCYGFLLCLFAILGLNRADAYLSSLSCNRRAPCSVDKVSLLCIIKKEEDIEEDDLVDLQWKSGFVPSEPTDLSASFQRNGDISSINIHWHGPDDSSNKDLKGFQIEIGDGENFYSYLFDLRGNENVFGKPEGMRLNYSLKCEHWNKFSRPVTLDIFVTSLPKSIDPRIKEKFSSKKMSISIPKYSYVEKKEDPESTSLGTGAILGIVIASIVLAIVPVVILIRIKGFMSNSASADAIYSASEPEDTDEAIEDKELDSRNIIPPPPALSSPPVFSSKCYTIVPDGSNMPLMMDAIDQPCPFHNHCEFQFRQYYPYHAEYFDSGFSEEPQFSSYRSSVMTDSTCEKKKIRKVHIVSPEQQRKNTTKDSDLNFIAPSDNDSMDIEAEMLKINGFV